MPNKSAPPLQRDPAAAVQGLRPVKVVFVWEQFGAYHIDRLRAVALALESEGVHVIGIEIASSSHRYRWEHIASTDFERITLFQNLYEMIPKRKIVLALLRALWRSRSRVVFLCNYNRVEIICSLLFCKVTGIKVFFLADSKYDDMDRRLWREVAKAILMTTFNGGLVSGARSRQYYQFLGCRGKPIECGYDSVSVARIRELAGAPAAPDGVAFTEREFVFIGRLVEKKNLPMLLRAYAIYRRQAQATARGLRIVGSGELEEVLRQTVRKLDLIGVSFLGFLTAPEVCKQLASALALILPSSEEQWGLVVNEALALGVPILCSDVVGARDELVRTGVNGFIFEADNPEGLAYFMDLLSSSENSWASFAKSAQRFAALGDTQAFVVGVRRLLAKAGIQQVAGE